MLMRQPMTTYSLLSFVRGRQRLLYADQNSALQRARSYHACCKKQIAPKLVALQSDGRISLKMLVRIRRGPQHCSCRTREHRLLLLQLADLQQTWIEACWYRTKGAVQAILMLTLPVQLICRQLGCR